MATPIIHDGTSNDILFPAGFGRGYVPRDYSVYPEAMFQQPSEMPLIPRSEWDARIKEQEEQQSSLQHIRRRANIVSLDQNGQGFCWAYSTTMTVMLSRAVANLPQVRLSAHGVACKVKGFKDEGGWCGLSAEFIRQNGVPSVDAWPEKSMARNNDNAATWADAAKYKITEDWVDLTKRVYDQNLTVDQMATCLLLNIPCALDFNHWSHSVTGIKWCKIENGSYGPMILNSWTDRWGDKGEAILQGQKGIPDGAIATRVVRAN